VLSDWDKHCITDLAADFEIDFINLSYARCAEDVINARE
jgi:pyruvate kinase